MDFGALAVGQHQFDYQLDNEFFAGLDQHEVLAGSVNAVISVLARESSFTLRMSLKGTVDVTCDRCLDPVSEPVEVSEEWLFKLGDEEGETDECFYLQATHPVFDLGWLMYEVISVNLPLVCRHAPGHCNPEMEKLLQEHAATLPDEE